jgi:hypothetical protein
VETGRPSIPKGIAQDAGGLWASQAPAADPVAAASHIISAFIQRGGHHACEDGVIARGTHRGLGARVLCDTPSGRREDRYPFGDTAGLIMYTPDGVMSAQLMRRSRPEFASGSWFDASDDELRAAASGYIAYSGPFPVDEKGTVTHKVGVSLYPNWIGQPQPRVVDLRATPWCSRRPIRSGRRARTSTPTSPGAAQKLRRSHNSKLSFVMRDDVARDPAQPQRVPVEVEHFRGRCA